MGISRQAHYQWQRRRALDDAKHERVVALVQEKRLRQPRLGRRKLHHLISPTLAAEGLSLGRDALFDLLRWNRLLVPTRRAYHKTTDSHHRFRRHPNLLKVGPEQVRAEASEQVWVADITYLPTRERCAYLSLVTDAYSRKIVGYHVHDSLHTAEVSQALAKVQAQCLLSAACQNMKKMALLLARKAALLLLKILARAWFAAMFDPYRRQSGIRRGNFRITLVSA